MEPENYRKLKTNYQTARTNPPPRSESWSHQKLDKFSEGAYLVVLGQKVMA
jgi:hypothetical protein